MTERRGNERLSFTFSLGFLVTAATLFCGAAVVVATETFLLGAAVTAKLLISGIAAVGAGLGNIDLNSKGNGVVAVPCCFLGGGVALRGTARKGVGVACKKGWLKIKADVLVLFPFFSWFPIKTFEFFVIIVSLV